MSESARAVRRRTRAGAAAAILACLPAAPGLAAEPSLEAVIAHVKPAVVLVEVKTALGGRGHGSGFVCDPSGLVLTNQHVVEGAAEVHVVLQGGRRLPASVVNYYRKDDHEQALYYDVAVLRISTSGLPVLPMELAREEKDIRQGLEVLVLGYPGGVPTDEVSVTRGIVSAVRRHWVQTDALQLPGNSGGPVIDRRGRLIGLATFGTGPYQRISGVVSAAFARDLAAAALVKGHPGQRLIEIPGRSRLTANRSETGRPVLKRWTGRFEPDGAAQTPHSYAAQSAEEGLQDFNGAQRYSVKRYPPGQTYGASGTSEYYADSSGLFLLEGSDAPPGPWDRPQSRGRWRRHPPAPLAEVRLPVEAGDSWALRDSWRWEPELAQAVGSPDPPVLAVDGRATVESARESVRVPDGTYDDCIRTTRDLTVADAHRRYRLLETVWYCVRGPVRVVRLVPGFGRWTEELEDWTWR